MLVVHSRAWQGCLQVGRERSADDCWQPNRSGVLTLLARTTWRAKAQYRCRGWNFSRVDPAPASPASAAALVLAWLNPSRDIHLHSFLQHLLERDVILDRDSPAVFVFGCVVTDSSVHAGDF